MTLRLASYQLLAFFILMIVFAVWRLDVIDQPPYGSAAMGLFTQASAIAHGDGSSSATPAPSLYRSSVTPSFLAGLMRLFPESGTGLMVTYRLTQFGLAAVMLLAVTGFLRPRGGWGGGAIVAAAVASSPIEAVQMELMGIDFPAVVLVTLASILLMSGYGVWAGIVGLLASSCKWTAISYLVAGSIYSLVIPFWGRGRSVGSLSALVHGLGALVVVGVMWMRWDPAYEWGGWVPSAAFGTSPLIDVWMWSPELLFLLAAGVIAVAALGRSPSMEESGASDGVGFGWGDPPLLLTGLMTVTVLGRLGWTGAVPAELAMLIPMVLLAVGWVVFSWPAYRPIGIGFFFILCAVQLINSTGVLLPALPMTIDFRTGPLRERSREYLYTDHALQVASVGALLESGRDTVVATVPPMVHYLSLPALGYVREPFEGYSLGGPTTERFAPIERIRTDAPRPLSVVYLRNRYAANHEWTIPSPAAGDELVFPRSKELRQQDRWKISRLFVFKPRQIPSESAEEKTRRVIRRFWPAAGALERAGQLLEAGRPREAEILLRQLLEGNPSDHVARLLLGQILEAREDYSSARGEYERVALGTPEYWQALSRIAGIDATQKNYEAADRAFAEAIDSLRKTAAPDPRGLASLYLRWAVVDMTRADWAKATEKLAESTKIDPSFAMAFRERGLALVNQKKWEESRAELEKSLKLDNEDGLTHFYLAGVLVTLKDWERARLEFVETLRIDPANLRAQEGLSRSLLKLRRYEEAVSEFEDLLSRVAPEDKSWRAELLVGLSDAQRGAGDWAGAITSLRRAVDLETETKEAANHLAWLLATAPVDEWRNGEEAVQLSEGFANDPKSPAAMLDTLAAAYAEVGQWDKSITIIQRAIEQARMEQSPDLEAACRKRLESYQQKTPYREPAPAPASSAPQ
jgi:tetratricopeptide (TPR) repeat protein